MSRRVLILDTSVLCCWLRVPGKDEAGPLNDRWNFDRIDDLLTVENARGSTFVLPIATLIETGNHIAQANDDNRYQRAEALAVHLRGTADEQSPWAAFTDQSTLWQPDNLRELADTWPPLAAAKISIGDATIKNVAEHYARAGYDVEILTGDEGLKAYQPVARVVIPRRRGGK